MKIEEVQRYRGTLPEDDDHPYRTGAWRPNHVEYNAWDRSGSERHDVMTLRTPTAAAATRPRC